MGWDFSGQDAKNLDSKPLTFSQKFEQNTSLAAKEPLAHRLQNPKWPPGGPKIVLSFLSHVAIRLRTHAQNYVLV